MTGKRFHWDYKTGRMKDIQSNFQATKDMRLIERQVNDACQSYEKQITKLGKENEELKKENKELKQDEHQLSLSFLEYKQKVTETLQQCSDKYLDIELGDNPLRYATEVIDEIAEKLGVELE